MNALLRVLAPGMLTTVQGLARHGAAHLGFPPGGAADAVALRLANRLVGNPDDAAGLEATLVGPRLAFERDATIALAGADFAATVDGEPVRAGRSFDVSAGQFLALGATRGGARAYVAVRGGVTDDPGRALRRGDVVSMGQVVGPAPRLAWDERLVAGLADRTTLRVTPGPQADWFPGALADSYIVSERSDRRGLRLSGPPLRATTARQLLTEGVTPGAVQVTPDGQPIVLFVDGPTTGGYPKIAHVITADLHRLGQLRPRDRVRFEHVGPAEAIAALREQERRLAAAVVPA